MDSGAFSFDGAPVPAGVTVADHAPGIAATDVTFGPNCPVAHDATVFDMRSKPVAGALHLDGNPGHPDNLTGVLTGAIPSRLSKPCIYQGFFLNQYMRLRPSFPTGVQSP